MSCIWQWLQSCYVLCYVLDGLCCLNVCMNSKRWLLCSIVFLWTLLCWNELAAATVQCAVLLISACMQFMYCLAFLLLCCWHDAGCCFCVCWTPVLFCSYSTERLSRICIGVWSNWWELTMAFLHWSLKLFFFWLFGIWNISCFCFLPHGSLCCHI